MPTGLVRWRRARARLTAGVRGRPRTEDSRASAELDPVYRKLWEDGAKDELPRAEAWLREAAPAITARLGQPGCRRPRRHPELAGRRAVLLARS